MQHASKKNGEVPVSEMEIVNTFTKLIFGDDAYSARELHIIEAFKIVDVNVLRDDLADMGSYLRNLGVREMIQMVSRLHRHMAEPMELSATNGGQPARSSTLSSNTAHDSPGRSSH